MQLARARGCGFRTVGAAYSCTALSENGRPVEDFIVDPPKAVDFAALGLSSIGVKLIESNGVYHIMDVVGAGYYPNVADFVEEVRRMGMSRRLPKTFDFAKLTPASRHILVHSRAIIKNATALYIALMAEKAQNGKKPMVAWTCPRAIDNHAEPVSHRNPVEIAPETCAGLWWHDIEGGTPADADHPRHVTRTLPSFTYTGNSSPLVNVSYVPAVFMALPISHVAVINDPLDKQHIDTMQRAAAASIPVLLEDS